MTQHVEVAATRESLAVITVDCYNLAEQVTAFYEAFDEEVPLPTTATVVGTTIKVGLAGARAGRAPARPPLRVCSPSSWWYPTCGARLPATTWML